jgi:integrase
MTAHPSWTLDTLIEAYEHHQRRTCGLRDQTLHGYGRFVRLFVRGVLGDHPIDPTRFRPSDVVEFVALLRGRFSPRSMKAVRTALRSFFRFLRAEGLCNEPLEAAIPIVAHWRLSTLPRYLSDEQLEQVLASPVASTPFGLRDHAIVVCLATLGLRPGEVAGLDLDDIDWRDGTLQLPSRKTRRAAVLPLPHDTHVFPNRTGTAFTLLRRAPLEGNDREGGETMPLPQRPSDLAPHLATHHRDAPASIRSGHYRHRPLARPREYRHHSPLYRSRSRYAEGRSEPRREPGIQATPVEGSRPASRLLGGTLTMRSPPSQNGPRARSPPAKLVIVRISS